MITLIIDVVLALILADKVGQGDINWAFGMFLCGVLWLNAAAVFKKVFK